MLRWQNQPHLNNSGFTLVELMVVVAISLILFGLMTINLGKTQETSSVTSTVDTLMSDIKSQQILAMSGNAGNMTSQQPQGLHIQNNSYVLYAGNSFNGGNANNFAVSISPSSISTTFPSSNLLFDMGDGSVSGFSGGSNTITVSRYGESKTITVSRYGGLTVN